MHACDALPLTQEATTDLYCAPLYLTEEEDDGNGLQNLEADNDDVFSHLGLEGLDSSGVAELLGLASILAKADSGSQSLDEAAQRLITSLQVW